MPPWAGGGRHRTGAGTIGAPYAADTVASIGGAEGKNRKSGILSRFARLCGGKNARIMVIPTASLLNDTGPQY